MWGGIQDFERDNVQPASPEKPGLHPRVCPANGCFRQGNGAVLGQVDKEGEEHPVSYFRKKFLLREERYSAIEKECLAVK